MTAYVPLMITAVVGIGLRFGLPVVAVLLAKFGPQPKAAVRVKINPFLTGVEVVMIPREMYDTVMDLRAPSKDSGPGDQHAE